MKKLRLNKYLLLFLITDAYAQQFTKTADLEPVKESAWHKIVLSPELRSCSNLNASDVRVYDSGKNPVPYILFHEPLLLHSNNFVPYKILSHNSV